jgi:hypothetical protein
MLVILTYSKSIDKYRNSKVLQHTTVYISYQFTRNVTYFTVLTDMREWMKTKYSKTSLSRTTLLTPNVQNKGYLITSDQKLYRFTPLKTSVRLLIRLLQSQTHITTIIHNYFLRCVTFTPLTIIHVRDYSHLLHSYTFTLADFWAIKYCLKLSHTLHLHTLKLSPRSHSANSPLKAPS